MVVHFGFWAFLLQSYLTATLFTLHIHTDEECLFVRELILFGFYSRLTSSPNPVRRSLVTKTLVSAHLARLSACWRDRAPAAVRWTVVFSRVGGCNLHCRDGVTQHCQNEATLFKIYP